MSKSPQNQKEKAKTGFWLLNPASKFESFLLTFFFLLLPTQLGKHFWPDFTLVSGIRIDYLSPIIYVTDVLLALLFGSSILRWLRSLKNSMVKIQNLSLKSETKKFLILIVLILFFSLNLAFSSRPLLSFYGLVKLCECAWLSFFLAKTIRSSIQLERISFLFAVSATFESVLAILQYINQGSLNGIFYFLGERTFTGATPGIANASINGVLILRPYATFPHPNVLAGYLLITSVLVWSFLLKSRGRLNRVIAVVSLLVCSIAILLTYSRIAIFLWILMVLLLLIRVGFRTLKVLRGRVIFFATVVIALLVISYFPITHEIVTRFIKTSLADESVMERTELLSASWKIITHHLFVGVGILNFIPNLAPLQKPLALNVYLQPVHNIFVLIAVETGLFGVGLFIWLLTAILLRIKKQELKVKGTFLISILIILVTGFFDHYWLTLQQGQLLFATVIGLSWAKYANK